MKILFIGDIVGKPGRRAIRELLPQLVSELGIDCVIANCENAAAGFGVTRDIVDELFQSHIDILTSGNHIWDKKDMKDFMEDYKTLLRPANYPSGTPGWGSVVIPTPAGRHVGVVNLGGRIFMQPLDCPFRTAEREIEKIKNKTSIIIIDFHAEATSEKKTMGWFLDGRVSAVLGTHTHVQTADEGVLPQGTAYISDVGMTGPVDSILGVKKELVLRRFMVNEKEVFEVAEGPAELNGVIIELNDKGKCKSIKRVSEKSSSGS